MNSEYESKIVIFCDDRNDAFWLNGKRERNGFRDIDWAGWTVIRIANPGSRNDDWTKRFSEAISNHVPPGSLYYIVTDAHFGNDPMGGSELLAALRDQLVRGVLFSVEPKLCGTGAKLEGEAKICVIIDDRAVDHGSSALAAHIRQFLEGSVRPPPSPKTNMQILPRVIHQLENLALPLRLDVETLESRGSETEVVGEIWEDYFGASASGVGFLLSGRSFSNSTSGIENAIIEVLDCVRSVPKVTEGKRWKALEAEAGFTSETVAAELGIEEARKKSEALKDETSALKQSLEGILEKIHAVANELRELRDHLEAKGEGEQS